MDKGLVDVHICFKDRASELAFLLESLMFQTYKKFHIYISDDMSNTQINNYYFVIYLFSKLNEMGHYVHYSRNDFNLGVSKNRQKLVELSKKSEAEYILRVDDDSILTPNYIEKLIETIEKGYDLVSGVVPFMGQPGFKRESKFLLPVGNRVILDKEGNFIYNGDDFGMEYLDEIVVPIHHFRSCALYKKSIHDKISYDSRLTKHGFREEQIFSFKCMVEGFKMAVNTKAIAWHLMTPSGGERFADSNELIKLNEGVLKEFTRDLVRQHGDFIKRYDEMMGIDRSYVTGNLSRPGNCII